MPAWSAIRIGNDVFMAPCHADALSYALRELAPDDASRAKLSDDIDNNRVQWEFGYADPANGSHERFYSITQRGINFEPVTDDTNKQRIERYVKPVIVAGFLDNQRERDIKRTWRVHGHECNFSPSRSRWKLYNACDAWTMSPPSKMDIPTEPVRDSVFEYVLHWRIDVIDGMRRRRYKITCENITVQDWKE